MCMRQISNNKMSKLICFVFVYCMTKGENYETCKSKYDVLSLILLRSNQKIEMCVFRNLVNFEQDNIHVTHTQMIGTT